MQKKFIKSSATPIFRERLQPLPRAWFAIAAAVFAVVVLLLALTCNDVGMAWDEGNDIRMTAGAHEWFRGLPGNVARSFSRSEIERLWGYEWKQHPAVTRIIYAAAYIPHGAPEVRRWKAFRAGPIIVFAALVAGVFLYAADVRPRAHC